MTKEITANEEMIEFYLEENQITKRFCGFNAKDKLYILELGISLLDHIKRNAHDTDSREWKDHLSRVKRQYDLDIDSLRTQLEVSEDKYETFARQATERAKQTVTQVEASVRQQYEEEITRHKSSLRDASEQYNTLMEKYQNIHTEIGKTFQAREESLTKQHQERIQQLEGKCDMVRREYEEKLTAIALRSENSTIKGQDGETFMLAQLNMLLPKWEIEDTHATPNRGDFILRHEDMCIMIENKNYSKNVQKSEVDKFYRDIDNTANNDIHCALMVSLTTGICCKDDFEFEMRNGKPIMFLHKVKENMNNVVLAMKFLQLVVRQSDSLNLKDAEVLSGFKNLASTIKRNFTRQKSRLEKFHAEQLDAITNLEANVVGLFGLVGSKY
jgi:hypothetical protein